MSQEEYTENLKVIVAEKLSTLQNFHEDIKYVAEYIVLLMVNGGTVETVVQELSTLFDSVSPASLTDVVQTAFFALEALQQGETVNSIVGKIRGIPEPQQQAQTQEPQQQVQSQQQIQPQQQAQQGALQQAESGQPLSAFSGMVPTQFSTPSLDSPQFNFNGPQPPFVQQRGGGVGKQRGGRGGRGASRGASRGGQRSNNARFNPLAKALGIDDDANASNGNVNIVHHRKEGRCKVFPRCPLGRSCPHAHPTKVCNDYPNCPKLPGTCEYLHPNQDEDLMREIEKTRDEFQQRKAALLTARAKPIRTGIVLCKFGALCSNPMCPFGHPTPANQDAKVIDLVWCPDNLSCTDPNCTRAHSSLSKIKQISPMGKPRSGGARENITASKPTIKPIEKSLEQCKFGTHCTNKRCKYRHARSHIMCREGANCTRLDCLFGHPINEDCKFGIGCRNASCLFRHPEGRVVPSRKQNFTPVGGDSNSTSQRIFAMPENAAIESVAEQGSNTPQPIFAQAGPQSMDHDTDMA